MRKVLTCSFLLVLLGCTEKVPKKKASFSEYVEFFTGNAVSVKDPVTVRFFKEVKKEESNPSQFFKISPSVKGTFEWNDSRTLLFVPEKKLKQNQEYQVSIDLTAIYDNVPEGKKDFVFQFKTLKQNFDVLTENIRFYDSNDLDKAKLTGRIQTADVVAFEALKKTISASQNGNPLQIDWDAPESKTAFSFTIQNIITSDAIGKIKIKVNGSAIGVDKKYELLIKVPSMSVFSVLSSKLVMDEENYISVLFSNPLNEKQILKDLILISTRKPKTVINGNELKVYLRGDMTGSLNLRIRKFIKSNSGKSLKEDYKTTLKLIQKKPQVRFVRKEEKAILPSSDALILPFEAIGLSAVEVSVVKIFTDNVLQHLQINKVGEQKQLKRVARPIIRKTIDLSALGVTNFEQWNTFSLNLSDLVKVDPGALYQVKIGFRRQHALYTCSQSDELIEELSDENGWDDSEEVSPWDNYENYYYSSNYQWEQRDNPCNNSYYGDRRSIKKLFLSSNLGIIAKRSAFGDLSVFVSNLLDTSPLEGAEITVYDYQQQLINSGNTDSDGKVKIDVKNKKPFVLVAKKDDQVGYLKLDDFSSLSLSNFDISGTKVRQGLKGFIYGERGVWRPSDTIHLTFILQDSKKNLPEGHPVIMELYDPNNRLTYRKIKDTPIGNMYRFDFPTDEKTLTGNWNAKVRVGGAAFEKRVRIETVKPNRLKINLEPTYRKLTYQNKKLEAGLDVSWLTGATAKNLKVEYEMLLKPAKTTFEGYANYIFDDQSRRFFSQRKLAYQGKLDAQGNARLSIDLGDNSKAPGTLNVMLFGKVYEKGGDFSINKTQIPYYPFKSFVGLKVPEGDKRGMLRTNMTHKLALATLDSEGNPISKKRLRVSLYKLRWRWWWDKSYENLSNYIGNSYNRAEYTTYASTQNGKGTCDIKVDDRKWGRYYVKVEDLESGHASGQIIYFDWPGWAGKGKGGLDGASMLDFSAEKEEYKVGEEIALSIPTTSGNRILVSLETGKDVLETFWVTTQEERTSIQFKATEAMAPNVYVHLTMIQPHNQDKNDLPLRLYGIKSIKVVDDTTRLHPKIELPSALTPEQTYTVAVSEKDKKPMTYTLAVVDEGLLDLTAFKTPDPWESFFKREALSVKTWDLYDNVMGAFATENTFMTTIGGDEELNHKDEKTANRFKPVVKFLGPFSLRAGERKQHTITMPQYLGSVRTMVVAASEDAYGNTEKATPVKQELMVLATMPRVIGPGETVKLPVNVFLLNNNIKDVSVNVDVSGALSLVGNALKALRFNKEGDQLVYFDLKASEALGVGKIRVTASSEKTTSSYDIELNVIPRNPFISVVSSEHLLSEEAPWEYDYVPLGLKGKNEAVLELSTLPPLNLESRLEYLIQYPHGCIEQTTSSAFPQLYLDKLMTLSEKQKNKIQANVSDAIARIGRFQTSEGGFAYWPGRQIPNEWGSNYAGHFLWEAKNLGYVVPETVLNNWLDFQTTMANSWTLSSERSGLTQAYRLYTLALAKKPSVGAMNRMKEELRISRSAKWRLALAYAIAGFEEQAQEIVATLDATVEKAATNTYRYTFGSQLRDQAMMLEALTALEKSGDAFEMLMRIAEKMGQDKWLSTQTTAYCLLGISKYVQVHPIDEGINVLLTVNGENKKIQAEGKYLQQVSIEEPEKNASIRLVPSGVAKTYVRFIKKGIPLENQKNDEEKNLRFKVQYLNDSGIPIDVTTLPKGTNFSAEITLANPGQRGKYTELALTQIFPSGWEIINTRLDDTDEIDDNLAYKDIRDDRVMHYFDLEPNKEVKFTVLLNATYEGKYYLPDVRAEAMYDNSIYANLSGRWVEVTSESN